MPACDGAVGQLGQPAQHRKARLPLEHGREQFRQPPGAAIEKKPADHTGTAEPGQPPHHGRQSEGRPLGAHHQQDGGPGGPGQVPAAGPLRAPHAVVTAHDPLQHRHAAATPGGGQQGAGLVLPAEKQVQVPAGQAQHLPVEHGVDIVRPALEGAGVQPPALKGPEQGAGHGGLAAAAGRSGHQQAGQVQPLLHGCPPPFQTNNLYYTGPVGKMQRGPAALYVSGGKFPLHTTAVPRILREGFTLRG